VNGSLVSGTALLQEPPLDFGGFLPLLYRSQGLPANPVGPAVEIVPVI
jgi:hypothetical protein